MLKRGVTLAFTLALIAIVTSFASARELTIGDAAPGLTVKRFVKGTPVTKFEKGKLYVVEFWATWCGPCRISIPHLTELQKRYKSVTFIGVSIFEQSQTDVAPFVAQMGAQMDYHVAMDRVPAGQTADNGVMALNWMQAVGLNVVPTAFIIDKGSRIAWIGRPLEMDEPLAEVVAGKWNLKIAAAEWKKSQAMAQKIQELNAELGSAIQNKDFAKVLSITDAAIAGYPELEPQLGFMRFAMLLKLDKHTEAVAYGNRLVDGKLKDSAQDLDGIAWSIVDPNKPKQSDDLVALALKAELRADDIVKHQNPVVADTLAAAYYASGKIDRAVETQERAINLAKGTQLENEPSLAQNLEKYKQALKK